MAEASCEGRPLFAYGTLMFPAVIKFVIGRVPDFRPAIISGYQRFKVAGESFPGLIREDGTSVEGLVYASLTGEEWKRLIAFEDDFYELQEVIVECPETNVSALAFIVPTSRKALLSDKTWNPDFFHPAGPERDNRLRRCGES